MRGWAAELGGEGFRNPGGAGPRVQMSSQREGQLGEARPGCDSSSSSVFGPGLEVALGPEGWCGGRLPEPLEVRGSGQSGERNNRPGRGAAAGRGLSAQLRLPRAPPAPSPRHHRAPTPRPETSTPPPCLGSPARPPAILLAGRWVRREAWRWGLPRSPLGL